MGVGEEDPGTVQCQGLCEISATFQTLRNATAVPPLRRGPLYVRSCIVTLQLMRYAAQALVHELGIREEDDQGIRWAGGADGLKEVRDIRKR